jgi:hypothetical protein
MMIEASKIPSLRRLSELDAARAETSPASRLDELRAAAKRLQERLRERGPALAVRTFDIGTFPYPAEYGFQGAARSPAPYVMLRNRMQLVQVAHEGSHLNILVNPSDAARARAAPFFAKQIERYGELMTTKVLSTIHGTVAGALAAAGVAPEDIDFVTFDHLHVQDLRGLLGTESPEPGHSRPTPPLLPNAKLLVQPEELRTLAAPHPLQRPWYVPGGADSVPRDRFVVLDGDYAIGDGGLAIIRTPGHTEGNQTLVIHTATGLWTISENGVAVESYVPEHSEIPGLRTYSRYWDTEVILNANTREQSLEQYTSMIVEKTLADPTPDRPEFPQFLPSSELVKSRLAPGLAPTFSHGPLRHGALRTRRDRAPSSAA